MFTKILIAVSILLLAFIAGCTADQLTGAQTKLATTGAQIEAGQPVPVSVPFPSSTQPTIVNVPTSEIPEPWKTILAGVFGLAAVGIGAIAHAKGTSAGANAATPSVATTETTSTTKAA